jgi:hypothetical protein
LKAPAPSPVIMARVRAAYLDSGLSYAEIGLRMGYKGREVARKKAFEFVNHTRCPTAAKLARYALAVGVEARVLLAHVRTPSAVAS